MAGSPETRTPREVGHLVVASVGRVERCDDQPGVRLLDAAGLPYHFHDFKKHGVPPDLLAQWTAAVGWEKLLNKSGTTFRKLPDAQKEALDAASAKALMLDQPAMIRRPVVEAAGAPSVGFSADDWQKRFA